VIARYQLFTQVYFHKTRRAYDYHLKEAMKTVLNDGKLPSPDNINEFIGFDDFTVWELFKNNYKNYNCKSILDRKHNKVVYYTPETPDESDEKEIEEKKKKLEDNNIWYYEDRAERLWYKLNGDNEEDKQVMIIKNGDKKARPLSNYSSIVSNMGRIKQMKIYVKKEDRLKAKEVLNNVT